MPLIFAIDNDKRQSAQLASLLRSHVDADLVQSATVLDGVGVLQGRIPDLVLTSSLLRQASTRTTRRKHENCASRDGTLGLPW